MPQAAVSRTGHPSGIVRPPATGSEFAPLLRMVRSQGLLDRRIGWYVTEFVVNGLVLAAILMAVTVISDSWWVLGLTPLLAVISARTAFIGHDAGHAQITGQRALSRTIGLIHGNLLLGMSYAWWNGKHNLHHANPNHIDKDPDVAADILVFTSAQAAVRTGFRRWLTRNQAWLFFPLILLEGIALKIHSFRSLSTQPRKGRTTEALLLLAHAIGYVSLLLSVMSPGKALLFAALHHALFGLHLGLAFAPNHKGMEMPDPGEDHWGHLRRQVLTSRNVRRGLLTDWFLGGLNYQVEHHLFPSMPRPHLRRAQPIVRAYCHDLGIPYMESGLMDSYRQALRHMHAVGADLRDTSGTDSGTRQGRSVELQET